MSERDERDEPPAATERGEKYNLPLRYDAAVDRQSKAEAAKWFADAFG